MLRDQRGCSVHAQMLMRLECGVQATPTARSVCGPWAACEGTADPVNCSLSWRAGNMRACLPVAWSGDTAIAHCRTLCCVTILQCLVLIEWLPCAAPALLLYVLNAPGSTLEGGNWKE